MPMKRNIATAKSKKKMSSQSFNRYNLFYRLERLLLLDQRGAAPEVGAPSDTEAKKWEALDLPPLPARYQGLDMPSLWFLSSKGSDKKRSHRKSHGVATFSEIAQVVANNWKAIDEETMNYVTSISTTLKVYTEERGIVTPNPRKRRKPRSTSSSSGGDGTNEGQAATTSSQEAQATASSSPMPMDTSLSLKAPPQASVKSMPVDSLLMPPYLSPVSSAFEGKAVTAGQEAQVIGNVPLPLWQPQPHQTSRKGSWSAFDGRSETPQVSNRTSSANARAVDGVLSLAPSSPSYVSGVEQSFLRQVLGSDKINVPEGVELEEPQTISSLLTTMTTGQRAERSRSAPVNMPSQQHTHPQAQRAHAHHRRNSMPVPAMGDQPVRRRASTVPLLKELDIGDEEILSMWTSPKSSSESSPEGDKKRMEMNVDQTEHT